VHFPLLLYHIHHSYISMTSRALLQYIDLLVFLQQITHLPITSASIRLSVTNYSEVMVWCDCQAKCKGGAEVSQLTRERHGKYRREEAILHRPDPLGETGIGAHKRAQSRDPYDETRQSTRRQRHDMHTVCYLAERCVQQPDSVLFSRILMEAQRKHGTFKTTTP